MKMSPFKMVILGFFALSAMAALGVLSGIITLPKSADENISGNMVIWGTVDAKAFQFTSNFIQATNKNISIQYIQKPTVNFESTLSEAIASGRGPDLVIISQEQILRNKSKIFVQTLTPDVTLSYKNTYINGAELFISQDGLVALPLAVDPLVMYYNDRLLTSAGFAKPPQFWDEMQTYVDALTLKNDVRDIRQSTVALGSFENVEYPLDILSALVLQTGNKIVSEEISYDSQNNPNISYKSFVSSNNTNQVLDFFNAFSNPQKTLYSWNISLPQDIDAFASEFSTFWFGYPTDEARVQAKNPNLRYKITSIPQIRTSKDRLTYGKIYGVAIIRTSQNIPAARFVQKILTQGDVQKVTVEDGGLQYPYRATPPSAITDDKTALYARQAIQTAGYYTPSYDFTYILFKNVLAQIASGALDSTKGVQRIESEINNYINKNQLK